MTSCCGLNDFTLYGPVPTGSVALTNVTGSACCSHTCFGTTLISPKSVNAAAPGCENLIVTVFGSVASTASTYREMPLVSRAACSLSMP